MKQRGGKRPGAGRRSLSRIDRLLIGAHCEKVWGQLTEQIALRKHEDSFDYESVRESRIFLNDPDDMPLAVRKLVGGATADSVAAYDAEVEIDDLNENLVGHRIVSFKSPRGQQRALIKRTAGEVSVAHRQTVTPRQVRRWWGEYREFCAKQHTQV
jgi:hypothetical protein